MQVAGETRTDSPEKLTQAQLSEVSGVARSTLALHAELEADADRSPNPKLEQICRIADALNVPPAFLLMRGEDWTRLAQAINYYADLRRTGRHPALFANIAAGIDDEASTQSRYALMLAKTMGIDGRVNDALLEELSPVLRREIQTSVSATTRRIFSSAALPPISSMEPDDRLAAFVISVIFGAHFRPEAEEPQEQ